MISKQVINRQYQSTVVSAVNLVDGGPLTVLRDVIMAFEKELRPGQKVVFLVSNPRVHEGLVVTKCEFMYFPKAKKSWLKRLFYEYLYFYFLSLRVKPDVWLSLHDITPNVVATKKYVYCHNPAIFLRMPILDASLDFRMYLFSKFYKFLYAININKNDDVFVQQSWIAKSFKSMYSIANVVVSRPDVVADAAMQRCDLAGSEVSLSKPVVLFYPAFPRYFKNHKILYELAERLEGEVEIRITVSRSENKLIKKLESRYPVGASKIVYLGRLSREGVELEYEKCDGLVFPSLLETWGLPINEVMKFMKPALIAELPYAKETAGDYDKVIFFDPLDPDSLASAVATAANGGPYSTNAREKCVRELVGWSETVKYVLGVG